MVYVCVCTYVRSRKMLGSASSNTHLISFMLSVNFVCVSEAMFDPFVLFIALTNIKTASCEHYECIHIYFTLLCYDLWAL